MPAEGRFCEIEIVNFFAVVHRIRTENISNKYVAISLKIDCILLVALP
jgi:hypothetical protein